MKQRYLQLLDRMVIDEAILPTHTILEIVCEINVPQSQHGQRIPMFIYGDKQYSVHGRYRQLSDKEASLYMQEVIVLRSHRVVSLCGVMQLTLQAGETLFIDNFTEAGEPCTLIDEYEYQLDDTYIMLSSRFTMLFSQLIRPTRLLTQS